MKLAVRVLCILALRTCLLAQSTPEPVTVPVTLDLNRALVDVRLLLPDGSTTRVRALVDPGNPRLRLTEALAKKLGLPITGDPQPPANPAWHIVPAPKEIQLGTMKLPLTGIEDAQAILKLDGIEPGTSAEINLPSTLLRNYDVVIDYPNRQLTVGVPGTVHFEGSASKVSIAPDTGVLRLTIGVAGKPYTLALGIGQSVGAISPDLMSALTKAHPDWPHMNGAVGPPNATGNDAMSEVLRIPRVNLASVTLKGVLVTTHPNEMLDAGSLGGDALTNTRVGLDYKNSRLYLKELGTYEMPGIDVVGLTLRPEPDNRYTVAAIVDVHGTPAVPEAHVRDVLVGVDGAPVTGATMGQVWSLLGGAPGEKHSLTLERDGKRFTVDAKVHRFLPAVSKPKPHR